MWDERVFARVLSWVWRGKGVHFAIDSKKKLLNVKAAAANKNSDIR